MTITSSLFEAFLKCPVKGWLRAANEPPAGNVHAEWVKAQNESYRVAETKRVIAGMRSPDFTVSPPADNLKLAKWCLAAEVVIRATPNSCGGRSKEVPCSPLSPSETDIGATPGSLVTGSPAPASLHGSPDSAPKTSRAHLDTVPQPAVLPGCLLETCLHLLERVPAEGRGKAARFIPIRFTFFNKLTKDDKLLLAYDALVLGRVLGRDITVGQIIHGDDHAALRVKTSALAAELRKRLEKVAALLSSSAPPDLVLNRHCGECEFEARCRKIAVEKDDLSLLAGMSTKERQNLRSKGIFTVTQLSYTFRPRRRPRRLRDKREKYHHALRALAIRTNRIHIVGDPKLKIEGTPVYLDVEGLPDRDFYYLIGLRIGQGDAAIQHSLWADSIEDEVKIWREFLAILETVDSPVLIHYGSYETTFFKQMRERYGDTLEGSRAAKAIKSACKVVSGVFARIYFPTYASGLKDVAGFLGFKWTEVRPAGLKTIIWRHSWAMDRASCLRDKLVTYNAEDCQALETLVCALTILETTQESGGSKSLASTAVQAEAIPRGSKFGNFSSPISDFEDINRAARWDYQRDRVYARTSNRRRILKAKVKRSKKPERVNKVVVVPDQLSCPKCGCFDVEEPKLGTAAMEDIVFGRRSLRWRVVAYQYHRHICRNCGVTYGSPQGFWPRSKFGRNLAAYVLYHVIELGIHQLAVKRSLSRLFAYEVSQSALVRIKAMAGEIYAQTRTMILQKIVRGSLVHVDETRANVRGRTGYVWVFTSLNEVAYLYSDSREGEMAQRTLADFKGVLVSDFFSAYDCLPCPQQKCLIHLMRDLNDQILDCPFDEELRQIVMGFAVLLKPMITTIDRYGLKTNFLRKHLKEVEHFYKRIGGMNLGSEAAVRCRDRFDRNRGKLFTFLEHDCIPWNNNNAEHTIKAFAALRNVMEGCATEKSLESYLVLLSVCQTCKYMGVDFLDFLRSGEKDIYALSPSADDREGRWSFRRLSMLRR
jgi:predicted RecB family nuclease